MTPTRREFLQTTSAIGLGIALAPSTDAAQTPAPSPGIPFAAPPLERVRIGFVGVGGMGSVHVANLLAIEGVELKAICDIVEWKVARAQDMAVAADQPKPAGYARGPRDFERMSIRVAASCGRTRIATSSLNPNQNVESIAAMRPAPRSAAMTCQPRSRATSSAASKTREAGAFTTIG